MIVSRTAPPLENTKAFPSEDLISTFTEFALVGEYVDMARLESQ